MEFSLDMAALSSMVCHTFPKESTTLSVGFDGWAELAPRCRPAERDWTQRLDLLEAVYQQDQCHNRRLIW